jgi:Lipid A 3-O-deacylase (PagL)
MSLARFVPSTLLLCLALTVSAQEPADSTYSRRNTVGTFGEYSNDSSHIILGNAENRKIGAIGFQYQRRLLHRPSLDFSYTAEVRPGMLESDPTGAITETETSPTPFVLVTPLMPVLHCRASTTPYSFMEVPPTIPPTQVTGEVVTTCGRRTVISQGFSPAGFRINLLPRHRLQPTFSTFGGYMFSTQQVPIPNAGSFNYTFEFGGGLELYTTPTRSIRLEYQVQHFSNKKTADLNPGVDSGFIKLTCAFGR